jgi:uncharacterized membrane protein
MTRRVVLSVLGVILLVAGFWLAVAGGAIMAITGSDNRISTGTERLSTPSTALVTQIADISGTGGTADALGHPDLRLSLSGTTAPTFIGIGPADAVDRYLAGAPVEKIDDLHLDPFRLDTTRVTGTARPTAPDAQGFWVARGTGTDPSLNWKITDGRYRLVLMNADGSPNVATDARVEVTVPHLFAIGIGVLVTGLVLLLLGVLLLVLGLRSPRRPAAAGFGGPSGGGWQQPGPYTTGQGVPHQATRPEQEAKPTTAPRPPGT